MAKNNNKEKEQKVFTPDAMQAMFSEQMAEKMGGGEEENPRDKAFDRFLEELYGADNIEMKTELTKKQVLVFAQAKVFIDKFNVESLDSFLKYIMMMNVSLKRKGRDEWVNVTRQLTGGGGMDEGGPMGVSMTDKLFGRW